MARNRYLIAGAFLVLLATGTEKLAAADIQPVVSLVVGSGGEGENALFFEILQAEIEGKLLRPSRYDLRLRHDDRDPEDILGEISEEGILFVRMVPRRDGSLHVEGDVWSGREARFTWSDEFEIDTTQNRFSVARATATEMVQALDSVFPGFGVIEFENRGYDTAYDLYVNEEFVASRPESIGLLAGTYDIQLRRSEPGFSHVVARYRLPVQPDDYVRLVFSLNEQLPQISNLTRLAAARDDWVLGYEINGGVMLPMDRTSNVSDFLVGTYSSILVTDVLFPKNIWGFETGVTRSVFNPEGDGENLIIANVPVMIFTGIQSGPLFRVDFIFRVGGGLNLSYLDWERINTETGEPRVVTREALAPVIRGVFEFGIRIAERLRVSIGVQETTVFESGGAFTWLGLQTSIGARF